LRNSERIVYVGVASTGWQLPLCQSQWVWEDFPVRILQRYDTASTNRAIFELDRRGWYNLWNVLFMNVISQIMKFMLDFSKMVVNVIVALYIVLYPM
jgi:hypothetical protein